VGRETKELQFPLPGRECVGEREIVQDVNLEWERERVETAMTHHSWVQEFAAAVTVADREGKIIEMNAKAVKLFEKEGGEKLIGTNVLDCHPEPAREKFRAIMRTKKPNVYTIEKAGVKKFIYQAPWYEDGEYAGVVELVVEIPFAMPHFVRD
jgi:PAS domain S-box-containing protein